LLKKTTEGFDGVWTHNWPITKDRPATPLHFPYFEQTRSKWL